MVPGNLDSRNFNGFSSARRFRLHGYLGSKGALSWHDPPLALRILLPELTTA